MEAIQEVFSYISGLGSIVVVPLMIMIIGLVVRLKPAQAIQAGVTVGVGLIGLNLVLGLISTSIAPVANILVEKFGLNLTSIDTGWATAAGVAFSTTVGAFIIPFILVVNIVLLALKATKTINIDIWNYWHYAFSGAVVYLLSGNIAFAFAAAAAHCVFSLVMADRTAPQVQDVMGLPGLSIPQGFAVTEVPVFLALGKVYDAIRPAKQDAGESDGDALSKIENNPVLGVLKNPLFLGLIIGAGLGIAVGYGVPETCALAMNTAALMFLLPRMIKVLMEGLLPISDQTKKFMSERYHGQQFYIGMDSAILLGHPTTVAVGLLLIPITLVLAMVLPGNTTLPMADLASTAYFVSMAAVLYNGKFWRSFFSGVVMMAIVLLVASFFAPQLTQFALEGGTAMPEGAASITGLSAGNLVAFALYWLFELSWIGFAITVVLIVAMVVWHRAYLAKQDNLKTTEFTDANQDTYLKK